MEEGGFCRMAFLQPDAVRTECGVRISQKIIPFGAVWPRSTDGFQKGDLDKADRLLNGDSGKPTGVCIHNTGRIVVPEGTTPAEQ